MNQILVTEKLYMTPELKKKHKLYRFEFFISVFLICLLSSYYIYAEYDKTKSEEVSKEIMSNVNIEKTEDATVRKKDDVLLVVLRDEEDINVEQDEGDINSEMRNQQVMTTVSGQKYTTVALIKIPKLGIEYPVLSDTTEELLKIAPNKFWGPKANEVGNFCVVGHNYRNARFFSKVPELVNGDVIEITDPTGRTIKYSVYDKYVVPADNVSCTSQLTNGKKEVTLITCTDNGMKTGERVIVKATEVL